VCAMFQGLPEFFSSISFSCQFAGFRVANRAVTRLLLASTACVCHRFHDARGRSAVRAQPWLLQRLLGLGLLHAVHWCVDLTDYRQGVCSEMTRYHRDRSTKVGHGICRPTRNLWFVNIFSTFRCQNGW